MSCSALSIALTIGGCANGTPAPPPAPQPAPSVAAAAVPLMDRWKCPHLLAGPADTAASRHDLWECQHRR
jgi:hypothetical protein